MAAVTVTLMRLRQAPRKVRLVVDLVRGKKVADAEAQLMALPKRAAGPVAKLLKSAEAAAKDRGLTTSNLWIQGAFCDQGAALKRRQLNSRGRASMIKKFYSHVTLTVSDDAPKGRKSVKTNKNSKSQSPNVKQIVPSQEKPTSEPQA